MNTFLKKITLFAFSIMFAFGGTFAPLNFAFADAPTVPTNGAPHNVTETDNDFISHGMHQQEIAILAMNSSLHKMEQKVEEF